ncbi:hypothetical protein [Oceanobacillus sp. 1P07AA]|uniref:hypothetical protein n=1 Tax=Oceanobacillus sp. 1P07AA TaxID=3132293 RepID=UPI0039A4C5BC
MDSSTNTGKERYFSKTNIINIVEQYEEICEDVICMLKQKEDTHSKEKGIQLLRDCINLTEQVRTYLQMTRKS